ncbi:MAG: hypothetical protein Q8N53_24010 [Longimicrobiales bacterium]|nr:hypothetical protein [Longimicrobiales bacterium]
MKYLPRTLPKVLAVPLVLAASACQDSSAPTAWLDVPVAQSVVVDFQAGNGAQFLFLPPLANGKPSAPLARGLDLSVTICDPSAACEVLAAQEQDDHYHANWKSNKARAGTTYSVTVSGSGIPLGKLSVTLESKGNDKAGSTFPIKFWVGQTLGGAIADVADCVGDDRCNADDVPPGVTTTIVTEDETGATMGEVVFPPAAVPAGGLIVTLDCRQGGYTPGEGPLPTDLDQWPLFCHVDARNPDGSEFAGTLPGNATIEICVVDELEPGQSPYHGFADHQDLLLGKSSTGSDFMFLPPAPEALSCIGATTTVASASPVGRFFDAVGSRLAWVLSPVLPQKLYARAMMFRDGGVGGLVTSFSDINPVEPAIIAGTVSYGVGGGGIGGVTVTLGGDASAVTTTAGDGSYSFGPLQAAVGGSSYTVTVSGAPTFAAPSQPVSVTGSGTFTADFQAATVFALNPDATFASGIFGGGGGGPFIAACPAGYVGVGMSGTTGGWGYSAEGIWDFGIECRAFLADGTLGASVKVGSAGSGTSGFSLSPFVGICTSGQLLTAVNGRWAYVTNEIGAGCATVSRVAGALGGTDSAIGPWAHIGGLGTSWTAACPAGYAVTGLTGRSGWVVDAVGFQCTQVIEQPL